VVRQIHRLLLESPVLEREPVLKGEKP